MEILLSSRPLGRIEAQTAKQIIFQRVKEAERKKVHDEYAVRLGDLVNGIIKNFEKGDIIVDLGTIEAILAEIHAVAGGKLFPGRSHPGSYFKGSSILQ